MGVKDREPRTSNELMQRVNRLALTTSVNSEFFKSLGTTAYDALLHEDIRALDTLFKGLDIRGKNPLLDKGTQLRLVGNKVIVAGGAAMLRRLRGNIPVWPSREQNREDLTKAVDELLADKSNGQTIAIARVIPDAILSYDHEYVQFGHDQLSRLMAPGTSNNLQMFATGMIDMVRPALTPVSL